jgi:hypothetical protein
MRRLNIGARHKAFSASFSDAIAMIEKKNNLYQNDLFIPSGRLAFFGSLFIGTVFSFTNVNSMVIY